MYRPTLGLYILTISTIYKFQPLAWLLFGSACFPLSKFISRKGHLSALFYFLFCGVTKWVIDMKKIFKSVFSIVFLIAILFSMCACQNAPQKNAVTSKNDGSFDANIIQSATIADGAFDATVQNKKQYCDNFSSTDGTVNFTLDVNDYVSFNQMPVIEVVPHYLTESDAKRVANVLFGNVTFYEAEPEFDAVYSKQDILNQINRWIPYTNPEKLLELYGNSFNQANYLDDAADTMKRAIARYTKMYETAPEDNPHKLCKWVFQPDSYYSYSAEELSNKNLAQDNEKIGVQVEVNGIPYTIGFSRRNRNDFKLNYIYAYPHTYYSPMSIDSNIFRAQLCRTQKPSDSQIAELKKKAQDMLDQMNLGSWLVDECILQTNTIGNSQEYIINIKAVPVFQGIPAIRRPQLTNLKSKNTYASNYYLTDAIFQFSADGKLLLFEMYSPIDIKTILDDNVAFMSIDSLICQAKDHLSLSDYNDYGFGQQYLKQAEQQAGEEFICKVRLCDLKCGMIRVKVPDTDESYYYVPGITIYGTIDYYGKSSDTLYGSSGETIGEERVIPLIAFNAIDGSIVQLQNE